MGFSSFLFTVLILPAFLATFFNSFDFLIPLLGSTQAQVNDNFLSLFFLLALVLATIYVFGLIFDRFKDQYLHNMFIILFGVSMGAIFGIFFETVSLIVVLIALSLYDIYAVFKGPLKSMFENLDYGNNLKLEEQGNDRLNSIPENEQDIPSPKKNYPDSSTGFFQENESKKEIFFKVPSGFSPNFGNW